MTDLPEHLERKWPGYAPSPRLLVGMILAGSLAVCGTVGTKDLRRDRERQELHEKRIQLIEAMNDMALNKLHFALEAERLLLTPTGTNVRSNMGIQTAE